MRSAWTLFTGALPGTCQVCAGWPAQPICADCVQRFVCRGPRCWACAALLEGGEGLCGACLTGAAQQPVAACVAAVDYAFPWDALMARFKFRGESGWAAPLAALMLAAPGTCRLLSDTQCMVPVPLTAERLGSRGYNQAWELTKALRRQAALAGGHVPAALPDALVRVLHTPDQHQLTREERLHNLKGAFVVHPAHCARISGAHVLLVDDVRTTGATLHHAAQALLHAGAHRVSALVLARTPPH